MHPALSFDAVRWRPTRESPAVVNGVTLCVAAGETVAVLGPSGCGKTSLLRLAAGLAQPESGSVRLGAPGPIKAQSPEPGRDAYVCLMFQQHALFPHMSVAENVAYGARIAASPAQGERRADAANDPRVLEALRAVGLPEFGARRPDALSGGQQQRVALARALVAEPTVLLLDEPLSNVDAALRRSLREDLRALQRTHGFAMLWVTHDHAEALAVGDRLVVMREGRIVQEGTPKALYREPACAFVAEFLGDVTVLPVQPVEAVSVPRHASTAWTLGAWSLPTGLTAEWPVDTCWVAIRPQAWSIGAASTHGLPGQIVGWAYLGRTTEYQVSTAVGELLVVAASGTRPHEVGAPVSLSLVASGITPMRQA